MDPPGALPSGSFATWQASRAAGAAPAGDDALYPPSGPRAAGAIPMPSGRAAPPPKPAPLPAPVPIAQRRMRVSGERLGPHRLSGEFGPPPAQPQPHASLSPAFNSNTAHTRSTPGGGAPLPGDLPASAPLEIKIYKVQPAAGAAFAGSCGELQVRRGPPRKSARLWLCLPLLRGGLRRGRARHVCLTWH